MNGLGGTSENLWEKGAKSERLQCGVQPGVRLFILRCWSWSNSESIRKLLLGNFVFLIDIGASQTLFRSIFLSHPSIYIPFPFSILHSALLCIDFLAFLPVPVLVIPSLPFPSLPFPFFSHDSPFCIIELLNGFVVRNRLDSTLSVQFWTSRTNTAQCSSLCCSFISRQNSSLFFFVPNLKNCIPAFHSILYLPVLFRYVFSFSHLHSWTQSISKGKSWRKNRRWQYFVPSEMHSLKLIVREDIHLDSKIPDKFTSIGDFYQPELLLFICFGEFLSRFRI